MSYRSANSGMYSSTSAMLACVVMTTRSDFWKTRFAARPAMADRRTLLSAATLLIFAEVTLELLVRDFLRVQLLGYFCRHSDVQLFSEFRWDLLRISQGKQNGCRFAVSRDDNRIFAGDEFGDFASKFANRGCFHGFPPKRDFTREHAKILVTIVYTNEVIDVSQKLCHELRGERVEEIACSGSRNARVGSG